MRLMIDIPDVVFNDIKTDNHKIDEWLNCIEYGIKNGSIVDDKSSFGEVKFTEWDEVKVDTKELENLAYQNGRQEGYALGFTRGFKAGWNEAKEEYSNVDK